MNGWHGKQLSDLWSGYGVNRDQSQVTNRERERLDSVFLGLPDWSVGRSRLPASWALLLAAIARRGPKICLPSIERRNHLNISHAEIIRFSLSPLLIRIRRGPDYGLI